MRKIKILPLILLFALALALLCPGALATDENSGIEAPPELESAAAVIIDQDTGRVLYELNADEQRYPASLTKVMTALLAVEAASRGEVSLDDNVTAGSEAVQGMVDAGSTAGIQVGETMTLRDLLYCAMLGSANEACNIIAVYISGSIDAFVADMNERAAEIGCTGTHFANTHGLPDSNHYTTARDFAKICRAAMANETFFNLTGTVSYTVPATNMSAERQLSNTNGLINPETQLYPGNYYEYARAGKTGHTSEAGYCLASLAEKDDVQLVCVVLGGQLLQGSDGSYRYTNFTDSRALYNWVFNNFSKQEILGVTELVTSVTVDLAEDSGQAALRPETAVMALVPNKGFDPSTLERKIIIYSENNGSKLTAPIASGTVLGEVTLSLDDVVLGSSNLVTSSTVELARSEYMKQEIAAFFSNIWVDIIIVVLIAAVALYIFSVVRYRKLHKRHLQSVAEARERAARRRESGEFNAVPPVEEKTTVLAGARQTPRGAQHTTDEFDKTTVITSERSHIQAPKPAAPGRTAQQHRPPEPRPSETYTPEAHPSEPRQPRSADTPHSQGSSSAPTDDKARRDYFEEFFRKK